MSEQKKLFVFGVKESGLGAIELAHKHGWVVEASDDKYLSSDEPFQPPIQKLIDEKKVNFLRIPPLQKIWDGYYDEIAISPGIPYNHAIPYRLREKKIPYINDVELALRFIPENQTVIGVTGTNGKTTVVEMIHHALSKAGKKSVILGNYGVSLARFENYDPNTILIVELSSTQLARLSTKKLNMALLINITPNHIDSHMDLEEYVECKFNIQNILKPHSPFIILDQVLMKCAKFCHTPPTTFGLSPDNDYSLVGKQFIKEDQRVASLDRASFKGKHDFLNALSAYIVCEKLGVSPTQFELAMESFQKSPHRIQFIAEKNGVTYIDDSKSTTPSATLTAIETIQQPIYLLAGGHSKGLIYNSWTKGLKDRVVKIFAYGHCAQIIAEWTAPVYPLEIFQTLEEAFEAAQKEAKSGSVILLSPGASSKDQFRDYIQRGLVFQRLVQEIPAIK